MGGPDLVCTREVGDRAADAQDARVSPRGEAEPFGGGGEEATSLRAWTAEPPHVTTREMGIEPTPRGDLALSCCRYPRSHSDRRLAWFGIRFERTCRYARHVHVEINAIEQR